MFQLMTTCHPNQNIFEQQKDNLHIFISNSHAFKPKLKIAPKKRHKIEIVQNAKKSFLLSSDYIRGFNFLSLRSNFILKWEYRPGSSLFLVWQQQRDNFEVTDNDLNLNDGFEKLIDSQSVNTFMVKFAYWLSS